MIISINVVIFQQFSKVQWNHWHQFKHSIVVGIRLLHSQLLMNSHFHFHVTVQSATSQVLPQQPQQYGGWARSLHWNTATTDVSIVPCGVALNHLTSTTMEFLNLCNTGTDASSCSGTPLKSNDTSMEYWVACNFYELLIEHPSCVVTKMKHGVSP